MYKSILILGSLLVLTGCTTQNPTGNSQTPTENPSPTNQGKITYTLAQVGQHTTKNDCWMAIEGKVYDVTPTTSSDKHPGGDAILEGCGKDATELFNTRPMGSKTPHSDNARRFLEGMKIGELATE